MANKPGPKGPHHHPRVVGGTLRAKAWLAMQIKGKFGLGDLCRAVLTGEEAGKNPRNNLGKYVAALAAVGIVAEMKRRTPSAVHGSTGEKRWVLIRDLGRLAPVRRGDGSVFDPNSGTVIFPPAAAEASDAR